MTCQLSSALIFRSILSRAISEIQCVFASKLTQKRNIPQSIYQMKDVEQLCCVCMCLQLHKEGQTTFHRFPKNDEEMKYSRNHQTIHFSNVEREINQKRTRKRIGDNLTPRLTRDSEVTMLAKIYLHKEGQHRFPKKDEEMKYSRSWSDE